MSVPPARVLIVCGGRDYEPTAGDVWWLRGIVQTLGITTIRHGDARGVDRWAGDIAVRWGLQVQPVPADWTMGRSAGPKRNRAMLAMFPAPVAVAALPGGRGTADMLAATRAAGVLAIESPRRRP
jgi:hypothetical protein